MKVGDLEETTRKCYSCTSAPMFDAIPTANAAEAHAAPPPVPVPSDWPLKAFQLSDWTATAGEEGLDCGGCLLCQPWIVVDDGWTRPMT